MTRAKKDAVARTAAKRRATSLRSAVKAALAGNADSLHELLKTGKGEFDRAYREVSDAYDAIDPFEFTPEEDPVRARLTEKLLEHLFQAMTYMRAIVIDAERSAD